MNTRPRPAAIMYAQALARWALRASPSVARAIRITNPRASAWELSPTIASRVRPGAVGVEGGLKFDRLPSAESEMKPESALALRTAHSAAGTSVVTAAHHGLTRRKSASVINTPPAM